MNALIKPAVIKLAIIILFIGFSTGCTTLEGPANPDDPFESFNRSAYRFNEKVDEYAFKPIAEGYQYITPNTVDTGITNFFNNLGDVWVLFNDLLQLKVEKALNTSARIVFNSTFGLLGFMDVATDFGIKKHSEDFGQTLGYWGVESGPYLVLPFFGPSSVRDGIGFITDSSVLDVVYDDMTTQHEYDFLAVNYIDIRADLLSVKDIIDETTPDPYAFIRDGYMQRRLDKVYDGNPPEDEDDLSEEDLFTDDIVR